MIRTAILLSFRYYPTTGLWEFPARPVQRRAVMIRMALIAALLAIWYRQCTGIDRSWRSVKLWFAEDARAWTAHLLRRDLQQCLASPT